jgi:GR25 family glycosyltransferase involved in LPS biosynthesis
MAQDDLDAALILEDDVALKTPEFHAAFAFALRTIRPGDYLKFQLRELRGAREVLFTDGTFSILAPRTPPLSTVAQLVTRDAAARLLEATTVFDRPVDVYLQMTWLTKTPLTVISPSCISDASPQLGGSTLASGKSFRQRLQHEFHRPLYRAQIAMLSRRYSKAG